LPILHSGGSEGVGDVGPPYGQQNQLRLRGFGGSAGRSQWAEAVHDRSDESGSATVRQGYLVSGCDCVTRNRLRDLTGAEHPYAHHAFAFTRVTSVVSRTVPTFSRTADLGQSLLEVGEVIGRGNVE